MCPPISSMAFERAVWKRQREKSEGEPCRGIKRGVRRRFEGCNFVPIKFFRSNILGDQQSVESVRGVVERREHWECLLMVFTVVL